MRPAFVILTSPRGIYRTQPGDRMDMCGAYGYTFCSRSTGRFVSATSSRDLKVRVVDEGLPQCVTHACSKCLVKFATIDAARERIRSLLGFGSSDISLCEVA